MSGYLHGLDTTGCEPIDAVLWAVIAAGDAYHHTDQWSDPGYDGGPSEIEQINAIAVRSANLVVSIQAENARLRQRLADTIAEWRAMGEESITAERAAAVIEGDLRADTAAEKPEAR